VDETAVSGPLFESVGQVQRSRNLGELPGCGRGGCGRQGRWNRLHAEGRQRWRRRSRSRPRSRYGRARWLGGSTELRGRRRLSRADRVRQRAAPHRRRPRLRDPSEVHLRSRDRRRRRALSQLRALHHDQRPAARRVQRAARDRRPARHPVRALQRNRRGEASERTRLQRCRPAAIVDRLRRFDSQRRAGGPAQRALPSCGLAPGGQEPDRRADRRRAGATSRRHRRQIR